MPTRFHIIDCEMKLGKIRDQGSAIPYIVDILDELQEIENRIRQLKALISKETAGYGIAVHFTEYDGTPCKL